MIEQPNSIIYALVQMHRRGHLIQQIIRSNLNFSGCSVYYFDHWVDLLANLSATPDERLPVLIALDVQIIRTDSLNGLSYLRNSHRLRTVPTMLLETHTRSASSLMAMA